MTPKEKLIQLAEREVSYYDDALCHAKREFAALSKSELKKDHGRSGLTKQQVLDGYERLFDEAVAALKLAQSIRV